MRRGELKIATGAARQFGSTSQRSPGDGGILSRRLEVPILRLPTVTEDCQCWR